MKSGQTGLKKRWQGDKEALERIVLNLQDMVFNLSLRMLGTFPDARTRPRHSAEGDHPPGHLPGSAFTTWVFRIATNHLIHYKKHMFAQMPLEL